MACHYYHEEYGVFPPAYVADENGRPMHSWRMLIQPFFNGAALYEEYDFSEPWDGPNNRKLISRMPQWLVFPGDNRNSTGVTNYLAVVGQETAWPGPRGICLDEISDPSKTIIIVENHGSHIRWTEPRDLDFRTMNFNLSDDPSDGISSKFRRAGVACADGTLRGLPKDIQSDTVRALLTVTRSDDATDDRIVEWPDSRDMSQVESKQSRLDTN